MHKHCSTVTLSVFSRHCSLYYVLFLHTHRLPIPLHTSKYITAKSQKLEVICTQGRDGRTLHLFMKFPSPIKMHFCFLMLRTESMLRRK